MILGTLHNVVISGNTIANTPRKGIQVADSPNSNVTITGNTITNTNTSHDADEGAITIYPNTTDISITNNTLTGNYQGFTVRDKAGIVSDVHVNFNNIYGNDGFGVGNFAQGGGMLNATNNWWGTTTDAEVAAMVSGNVAYDPWHLKQIGNLAASNVAKKSVDLTWTTTAAGTFTYRYFDVRYSEAAITSDNWGNATRVTREPVPVAGTSQS
ncbi:unnamed protein product, partial [marine sediment metagenome]